MYHNCVLNFHSRTVQDRENLAEIIIFNFLVLGRPRNNFSYHAGSEVEAGVVMRM